MNLRKLSQLISKWSYIKKPQHGTIQKNNVFNIYSNNQFLIFILIISL
jgi:hypothetical protein